MIECENKRYDVYLYALVMRGSERRVLRIISLAEIMFVLLKLGAVIYNCVSVSRNLS